MRMSGTSVKMYAAGSFARKISSFCLVIFLIVILAACSGPGANTTPTATPASSGSPTSFTVIPLGLPAAAYNAPTVGPLPADSQMDLGVSFKTNASVVPPTKNTTNKKGQNVDGSRLANAYGITDAQYQEIKQYLGIEDVQLTLGKLHSYMSVVAKASTIEKLFQTQFIVHKLNGRNYYVPAANEPPKLPSSLTSYIVAITGLESYFSLDVGSSQLAAQVMAARASATRQFSSASCNAPEANDPDLRGAVYPAQLAAAYGYNQFYKAGDTGNGLTVNLAEIGGYIADDLTNYFNCVNFPASQLNIIDTIPPANSPDADGTGEAMLDIEMVAGLAPGATINDYEAAAPSQDTGTLFSSFELLNGDLQRIINDNAEGYQDIEVVSVSMGFGESDLDPNVIAALDASISTLVNVEKMTVFFSTGDCGAFGTDQLNHLSVQFPASDPNAVAVGGTVLTTNNAGARTSEIAWGEAHPKNPCNNLWGGGGGLSSVFKRPSWQVGPGVSNKYSNGYRQLPDVSAIALNLPVFIGGQWGLAGGTSAATPIWATGFGLANVLLATNTDGTYFYGPQVFYAVATSPARDHPYFDITQGNNLHYPATLNWDDATGWGAPNLPGFYNTMLYMVQHS